MRALQVEQGTAAWLSERCGRITASRICDVMDQLKRGGEGANRRNYRIELIAERLTNRTEEHYVSPEMAWGTEFEAMARMEYEIESGVMVDQVGLVLHPTLDYAAASPDGLIGTDGCIEIKSPKTSTHIRWMLAGGVPPEHQEQCLWVMRCCERSWCDFISYDPRLPDGLKLSIVRMHRDDDRIAQIEAEVVQFNCEVDAEIEELTKRVRDTKPSPAASPAPDISDWASAFDDFMQGEVTP